MQSYLAWWMVGQVGSLSVAGDLGVTVLAPDLTCACQALVDGTVWGRNTPSYDIGWVNFGGVTRVSDPVSGYLRSLSRQVNSSPKKYSLMHRGSHLHYYSLWASLTYRRMYDRRRMPISPAIYTRLQ